MRHCFKNSDRFYQFLLVLLFFALLLWACDVPPDIYPEPPLSPEDKVPFIGSSVSGLTHGEQDRVIKDTITPPNNPMNERPYIPGTHTFRGVLHLKYFEGELYCAIHSVNNNVYFLTDNAACYLIRLDNILLSNCAVGDTVLITAEPMKLVDDFSLATYYIQPN